MFALVVLARFMDCDGWINKKSSVGIAEVFKLANVTASNDERYDILNSLYHNGYITTGKKIDNLNVRVNLPEGTEIFHTLNNIDNLGNIYISLVKKNYILCTNCGRKVKKTNNRVKYCSKCYKLIHQADAKYRMRKYRENMGVTF